MGRREETFTQNLSESFAGDEGCIEVVVRTYNINYGHNGELLEKCPTLNGYAKFVSMVRENLEMMELPKAVEHAVTVHFLRNQNIHTVLVGHAAF